MVENVMSSYASAIGHGGVIVFSLILWFLMFVIVRLDLSYSHKSFFPYWIMLITEYGALLVCGSRPNRHMVLPSPLWLLIGFGSCSTSFPLTVGICIEISGKLQRQPCVPSNLIHILTYWFI